MQKMRIVSNFVPINATETEIEIYDAIASEKSYDFWTDTVGNEVTPDDFKEQLNSISTPNITVRINSGGGVVSAATAISSAIGEAIASGKKVACKIDGICASAAVQIALSCSEVAIHRSALMMIHNPMSFVYGYMDTAELEKVQNVLSVTKDSILDTYEHKTGLGRQELSDMMDRETWMTGKEAVDKGFADRIMFDETDDSVMNRISASVYNSIAGSTIPERFNIPAKPIRKKEVVKEMDVKTVEDLVKTFPELTNQVKAEAVNAAREAAVNAGIEQERARMQAIDEMAGKVSDDLLKKAKYETFDTAEAVAVEAIKTGAFVNAGVLNALQKETEPNNAVNGLANDGNAAPVVDKKQEEKAKAASAAADYFKKIGKGE